MGRFKGIMIALSCLGAYMKVPIERWKGYMLDAAEDTLAVVARNVGELRAEIVREKERRGGLGREEPVVHTEEETV